MDRRKFVSRMAAGAGLLPASNFSAPGAAAQPRAALPPLQVKLGHEIQLTEKMINYAARCSVEWVGGVIPKFDVPQIATVDELKAARDMVEKKGMKMAWTGCPFMHATNIDNDPVPAIKLGQSPQRDRDIEMFQNLIRNCAAAGVPTIRYLISIMGVVRTGNVPGRGDAVYGKVNFEDARKANLPLTKAGIVGADAYWERIDYFLSHVVPVANEYKVKIACHPNDPGMYPGYRGVDLVLGSADGMKKFVTLHESPYHGMTFCQGTMSENLDDPNAEIGDVIRWFGSRKKIFVVEFRNIKGKRGDFIAETFPDEGVVDFVKALKVFREIGYDGPLLPDHAPAVPDNPNGALENFAFELGYIRGLIQAENHIVS